MCPNLNSSVFFFLSAGYVSNIQWDYTISKIVSPFRADGILSTGVGGRGRGCLGVGPPGAERDRDLCATAYCFP